MPALRILLRPTFLASVLAHGGLVAVGLFAVATPGRTSPASITTFISEEWSGSVDVEEVPVAPVEPRDVAPLRAEPGPAEAPVAEDGPSELETPPPSPMALDTDFGRVPVGLRTSRPVPEAPVPTAPVAAVAPVAPPQVAQRAGAGPTVGANPIGNQKPPYPPQALVRGWQGVARVLVTVRADGTVGDVRLASSSGYRLLDDTAVRAAWSWRYEPRLVDGVPAPDLLEQPVEFRIR
ncbi:MAG TPA: TonB family protein [Planctomycetota bacterium]|nr:TonB family protein [Planctomycetota bacterium]